MQKEAMRQVRAREEAEMQEDLRPVRAATALALAVAPAVGAVACALATTVALAAAAQPAGLR